MALEFTKSEAKEWARKNYHGLDGTIAPSFTPDLSELDEEGIRWDVQHNIRKGMFSVLCETMIGVMSFEERKRFMEIVCDEAKGKILVSVTTGIDDVDQDIELLKPAYLPYMEAIGYDCNDWALNPEPVIEPQFSSEYMKGLLKRKPLDSIRWLKDSILKRLAQKEV